MKMNKFFFFALAALSLTACSKDNASGNEDDGQKDVLKSISVSFVDSNTGSKTRGDYDGMAAGEGAENAVYYAFVFARELSPSHPGALIGDWTVKQVGDITNTTPLNKADGSAGSLTNMCTFDNVRQGENVYVIANDPNMTLEYAEQLSRKGPESESYIKGYISELSKLYLNKLVKAVGTDLTGDTRKFVMAGKATIRTNAVDDNQDADNRNVAVEVGLDRELAKVAFSATVTANASDEAAGKVYIGKDDGIVVVRIPRKVSYFTQMDRDWYFPAKLTSGEALYKDWGMQSTTTAATGWTNVFQGDKQKFSDPTQVGSDAGTAASSCFNDHVYNEAAKEYRLTWKLDATNLTSGLITYGKNATNPPASGELDNLNHTLEAPIFYATPNYSNDAASSTVVCTQATIKKDLLINDLLANQPYQALYDQLGAKTGLTDANDMWTSSSNANVTAFFTYLAKSDNEADVKSALGKIYSLTDSKDIDTRYDAVIAQVGVDNPGVGATPANFVRFKKDEKVYYRADVARYVGGASQKVTERNTYYQVKGTITSIGAESIEDAITTTLVGMTVQVVVKKWAVVISEVNM